MNAIILSVLLLFFFVYIRLNIIIAIILSALCGSLVTDLSLVQVWNAFLHGLGGGSVLAMNYALIGGFAYLLSQSGVIIYLLNIFLKRGYSDTSHCKLKYTILFIMLAASISSQNILPVHVAFIPLCIPPLLPLLNKLQVDRRRLVCIISFGLVATYMFLPFGFGYMFYNTLVIPQIENNGVNILPINITYIMLFPFLGMLCGLLIAVFFSYRNDRAYSRDNTESKQEIVHINNIVLSKQQKLSLSLSVLSFIILQVTLDSMAISAIVACIIMGIGSKKHWRQTNDAFFTGTRTMASIGIIMMVASGFAEVMKASGHITLLVQHIAEYSSNHSVALIIFCMLAAGLLVTLGIGSSFATVPILATIYVPVCQALNLNAGVILCLLATAAVLGDTGSLTSEVTLMTTSVLNQDGNHDHMRDTVIPTFLHFNIPLLIFGTLGCLYLMG